MSNIVKHRFPSPKLDGPDTTQIQPSHWNDGHAFTGGNNGQFLVRDTADATYGAKWLTPPPPQTTDTLLVSSVTGTVNDWAPGLSGNTAIVWNGTAPLTITGFAGGVLGQRVTVTNYGSGAGIITLGHLAGGSAAANRLFNMAVSAPTPLAYGGSATYIYNNTAWVLLEHDQGAWIASPYSAADYTASAGTWTVTAGNVLAARYLLQGRTLHWTLAVNGSSLSTTANVYRRIMGGFTQPANTYYPFTPTLSHTGGSMAGLGVTDSGLLIVYNPGGVAIPAGSLLVYASGIHEVS